MEDSSFNDERGASDLLDGLGLGKVLLDLGVADDRVSDAMTRLGVMAGRSDRLQSAQIYKETFEDDDGEMGLDAGVEGPAGGSLDTGHTSQAERYYQSGLSMLPSLVDSLTAEGPNNTAESLRVLQDLLPEFHRGEILDFTQLFLGQAPSKKRRLGNFKPQFSTASEVSPLRLMSAHPRGHIDPERRRKVPSVVAPARYIHSALDDPSLAVEEWAFSPHRTTLPPSMHSEDLSDFDRVDDPWDEIVRWHASAPPARRPELVLDMNDPEMIFEDTTTAGQEIRSGVSGSASGLSGRAARAAAALNPLNLSNDRFYEVPREHRQKVRQTLGQLVVQHARPAIRLQLPFYKTRLSKGEIKSFHRPAMQFPVNVSITFTRLQSSRKKREDRGKAKKGKDPSEILRSSRDLTLKDTGSYVLYEYSEEHPTIVSNLGMGHLLVNYYRKKTPKDENIPKSEMGESFVLDVSDESPFMGFGTIERGQLQPTLYNNLVRAPLFKHTSRSGDFLLIRHVTKNDINYYLRDIPHMFTVGQLLPTVNVPGPHARLATNMIKTRLHMIAHKLIQRSSGDRIKIHRLMRYFPDQNELQMRQRLKEFMEYSRRAGDPDQGYWKLKRHLAAPDEDELFRQLPPEHMVLCESMQAGQQRLVDAGFSKSAEGGDDEDDEDNEIEQVLAPWTASKNFLNGAQGKAMLALHGEGDPSGRGDAFSFIRVSMKEVFLAAADDTEERRAALEAEALSKSGHKYNVAEQQQVYRSEISRIWGQQRKTLSNPMPAAIDQQDLVPLHRAMKSYSAELQAAKAAQEDDDLVSNDPDQEGEYDATKVLRIKRKRKGIWHTEIIRDKAVIHAYLRQRHAIQDAITATEELVPTGDAVLDAARQRRLAAEIGQLQKNQDRRLQRKRAKAVAEGHVAGSMSKLGKSSSKRMCGRCGQIGHVASNTSCPMYGQGGSKGTKVPIARAQSPSIDAAFGPHSVTTPAASPPADTSPASSSLKLKLKLTSKRQD